MGSQWYRMTNSNLCVDRAGLQWSRRLILRNIVCRLATNKDNYNVFICLWWYHHDSASARQVNITLGVLKPTTMVIHAHTHNHAHNFNGKSPGHISIAECISGFSCSFVFDFTTWFHSIEHLLTQTSRFDSWCSHSRADIYTMNKGTLVTCVSIEHTCLLTQTSRFDSWCSHSRADIYTMNKGTLVTCVSIEHTCLLTQTLWFDSWCSHSRADIYTMNKGTLVTCVSIEHTCLWTQTLWFDS